MEGGLGVPSVMEHWLDAWQRSTVFLDVLRDCGNISKRRSASEAADVVTTQTSREREADSGLDVPPLIEYWLDAWQRSVLFLDVLRERGNIYQQRRASEAPHVLGFRVELVVDGRKLPRPVNYALVRIIPPPEIKIDRAKRPFIIVDPRAGHGPGIGGMKHDSEIGVALAAGHPCYFVGFLPEPMPDQTVEDVCRAEALFVEEVTKRHPDAPGKPVIIGNCQAGWQIMMMAAIRPELAGPIMLAGSPLSYWAGVRGKNPMRYTGGMLGGTWLTALAGDLDNGKFDGANLVANFEQLNPANTYWQKPYNVYSKIDTETHRFLDFETWWGSPVLLNATEMQWIADNLFVGNKLATGELRTADGLRIDLRNIRSPIIVFCSWGDNITPPQQALGWVTDMYADENEIVANGQTIIYTLHQSIGHLGIFVSGKVASKEHDEFTLAMDLIEMMPPGLYEAVITEPDEGVRHPELIQGKYLFRLERRTLADIRALGVNTQEDNQRFATVARLSDINRGLYESLAGPVVRAMTSEPAAELMRRMHPNRLRFSLFSDENPLMQPVKVMAESVRQSRRPASPTNPFVGAEHAMSSWIATCWETWGNMRDTAIEATFLATYGSPLVQALVGLGPHVAAADRRMERDVLREAQISEDRHRLERRFEVGGPLEAGIRALIYIRITDGSVDERGFAMLKTMHAAQPQAKQLPMAELKGIFREQFLLVSLDEARALQTLPLLLSKNAEDRKRALDAVHRMLGARDPLGDEAKRRLVQVEQLFDSRTEKSADRKLAHA